MSLAINTAVAFNSIGEPVITSRLIPTHRLHSGLADVFQQQDVAVALVYLGVEKPAPVG